MRVTLLLLTICLAGGLQVLGDEPKSSQPAPTSTTVAKRSNVLLIITDDQNDYASAASGVTVPTPPD